MEFEDAARVIIAHVIPGCDCHTCRLLRRIVEELQPEPPTAAPAAAPTVFDQRFVA